MTTTLLTTALRGLVLPLAGLALAACAAPAPIPAGSLAPAPSAVPVTFAHTVRFAADAPQPSAAEATELATFLGTLPTDRELSTRVIGRVTPGRDAAAAEQLAAARARAVARLLGDRLRTEPALAIATSTTGDGVEVRVDTFEVLLPACPDWSRDPAFDWRNLPLSNLGCANATNLGLMAADPADLVRGRRLGPADGVREADAITRYRTDKVKQLEADVLTP